MEIILTALLAAPAIALVTGYLLPTTARVSLARIANPTPGHFLLPGVHARKTNRQVVPLGGATVELR
jgi:hypothetical protein